MADNITNDNKNPNEAKSAPDREAVLQLIGSREFRKLQEFYKYKSSWEILGISRRELSHSNFLAWLLDQQESHELGYFSLRRLFQCLVFALGSDNNKNRLDDIRTFSGLDNFDV